LAAYSCSNLNTNRLATGDPSGDAQREAENGLDFARKARFALVIDIITAPARADPDSARPDARIRLLDGEARQSRSPRARRPAEAGSAWNAGIIDD
jgi:hypothetical protein